MGGAGLAEAEAANELKAQAKAHLVLHGVEVWSGGPKGEQHGATALRIFEQLGDLTEQAHMLNNMALRRSVEGRWPDALPYVRAGGRNVSPDRRCPQCCER